MHTNRITFEAWCDLYPALTITTRAASGLLETITGNHPDLGSLAAVIDGADGSAVVVSEFPRA